MQLYEENTVKEMLPAELRKIMEDGTIFQLIDVRERAEHETENIGGDLIPLSELLSNTHKIPTDKPVIIYCKVGLRSHIAIQRLQEKYGFGNLFNLKGGITAYLRP